MTKKDTPTPTENSFLASVRNLFRTISGSFSPAASSPNLTERNQYSPVDTKPRTSSYSDILANGALQQVAPPSSSSDNDEDDFTVLDLDTGERYKIRDLRTNYITSTSTPKDLAKTPTPTVTNSEADEYPPTLSF